MSTESYENPAGSKAHPPSDEGVSLVISLPIAVFAKLPKTMPFNIVRVFREEVAQAVLNCLEFIYGSELFDNEEYPSADAGKIKFRVRDSYGVFVFKDGNPFYIEDEKIYMRLIYIMTSASKRLLFQLDAPGAGLSPNNLRYNRIVRAAPGIIQRKRVWSIVRGQLIHSYKEHPDFFTRKGRRSLVSIAKRVTGDVWAYIERNALGGDVYTEPTIEGMGLERLLRHEHVPDGIDLSYQKGT